MKEQHLAFWWLIAHFLGYPYAMISRLCISSPSEFRRAYEERGKPCYALTEIDSTSAPNQFLQPDEYLLGDSIVALVREALDWEAKRCSIRWNEPTDEEIAEYGSEVEGSWYITNVPEFVNDVFINSEVSARLNQEMSQDELQEIVLPELVESDYGLLLLRSDTWDEYLHWWGEEVNKQCHPERYRTELQRFIIEQRYSFSVFSGKNTYAFYSNTGVGGKISVAEFDALGLRYEDVGGIEGVVNGLDEIVEINGIKVQKAVK